jgi:hypothetical protein
MTETIRRMPPEGEMPQRQLALELRYAIDVEMLHPTAAGFARVQALIEANPYGVTTRHVEHNLGATRLDFLHRNGLLS